MKNKQRIKLIGDENKILETAIKIHCADCQGYEISIKGCEMAKCPLFPFQIKTHFQKDKKLLRLINCYRKLNESGAGVDKDYWLKKIKTEILGSEDR